MIESSHLYNKEGACEMTWKIEKTLKHRVNKTHADNTQIENIVTTKCA